MTWVTHRHNVTSNVTTTESHIDIMWWVCWVTALLPMYCTEYEFSAYIPELCACRPCHVCTECTILYVILANNSACNPQYCTESSASFSRLVLWGRLPDEIGHHTFSAQCSILLFNKRFNTFSIVYCHLIFTWFKYLVKRTLLQDNAQASLFACCLKAYQHYLGNSWNKQMRHVKKQFEIYELLKTFQTDKFNIQEQCRCWYIG